MELPKNEKSDDSKVPNNDISFEEFIEMGKKYLVIPLALIFVEIIYQILTASQDTLAWIQVFEAKLWNSLNHIFYGADSSTLVEHSSGLMTQVKLHNANFPEITNNTILLYVSDECAGVHEILFISTLILLTPNVTKNIKLYSIAIMSVIIFFLNMARLLVLYPLAVNGCEENQGITNCEAPMMDFHTFVFEWGFLITLTVMWLIWYLIINGIIIKKNSQTTNSEE